VAGWFALACTGRGGRVRGSGQWHGRPDLGLRWHSFREHGVCLELISWPCGRLAGPCAGGVEISWASRGGDGRGCGCGHGGGEEQALVTVCGGTWCVWEWRRQRGGTLVGLHDMGRCRARWVLCASVNITQWRIMGAF